MIKNNLSRCLVLILFSCCISQTANAQRTANQGGLNTFRDGISSSIRASRLTDDRVLIAYRDAIGSGDAKLKVVVGTVSGTNITYGTEKTVVDGATQTNITFIEAIAVSSTKGVVLFEENTDPDVLKYVVVDIDGTAITVGGVANLATGEDRSWLQSLKAVALSDELIVVAYEANAPDDLEIVAGTISGTTITWGASVSVTINISNTDLTRLSSTKFALVYEYNDGANAAEGMIMAGTVSGTTITAGVPQSFESSTNVGRMSIVALSETEVVVVYEDDRLVSTNPNFGKVFYATVSGTVFTFPGNKTVFYNDGDGTHDLEIDVLSNTEVLFAVDGGAGDPATYYTGVLSGNDINISSGTVFLNGGQADDIMVTALTSDLVVLNYTDDQGINGTVDRGDSKVLTLAATTNPEIDITGNSVEIEGGDVTPSMADHTNFGTGASLSRTFTIQNNGTGILTLGSNAVTLTGTNVADFTVSSQPATSVSGNSTSTFTIDFSSAVTSTRTAKVHINSNDIHEKEFVFAIEAIGAASAPTSATVAATVFLEGAYNGTNLNTSLNSDIPLTQPYSNNGHSGGSAGSIPVNAVDWVLVELREAGSAAAALNATKVGSTAGFLMNDGTIKATDGTSDITVSLSGNSGADFFVVIYHRNHLPIMSANAISESGSKYTIDFTSSSANTHQTTTALSSLSGGKFGMPSGDADGDGDVDGTDLTTWRSQNGNGFTYNTTNADFNLDGVINAIDRNLFWKANNTSSKTSQVPTT